MASRVGAARSRGNSPWKQVEELRPEEESLHRHVLLQKYILMAVTGIGYLALLWSTVVLLGGFVSSLGKKDFWCLTAISMLQASRIINDWEDGLAFTFLELLWSFRNIKILFWSYRLALRVCFFIFSLPFLCVGFLSFEILPVTYTFGPVICAAVSLWRMIQRDYGNMDGDSTKANLAPALDLFYSLVICQGVLFSLWQMNRLTAAARRVALLCEAWKFHEEWCSTSVVGYFRETRKKCQQDPNSIKDMRLIKYAVELLASESSQDYLSGTRMLDMFIKQGVDVRSLILPSRPKIQKLIDTLRWRSSGIEIRELAARVLAYLARDIDLTQYPGATRCISSLLDTTLPFWKNQQEANYQSPKDDNLICDVEVLQKHRANKKKNRDGDDQQGGAGSSIDDNRSGWNELILQGLIILERLASDQHNSRDICCTANLLPKIMTPLYSDTLVQDINVSARANVVNGSFKLVHQLIRAPGWTGRRLRREICANKQAVSNLESILDQDNKVSQELQIRTIEILTELALDLSTTLSMETKEYFIRKQLQIFLTGYEGKDPGTMLIGKNELKVKAGQSLALLSKTETISMFMVREYNDILDRLTGIVLDAQSKIMYRTEALEILENLFTHCMLDVECVRKSLLPKVLTEIQVILTSKRKPPKPTEASETQRFLLIRIMLARYQMTIKTKPKALADSEELGRRSSEEDDEENRLPKHDRRIKSSDQENEEQIEEMELQALLSLTLVICNKLVVNEDDFDDVAQNIFHGDEVVVMLKAIVDLRCQATVNNSLRTVQLCGQIAVSLIRHSQYTAHFKNHKFVESLCKASEIMSSQESCTLLAGAENRVKNTARPFLSDLEAVLKEAVESVGSPAS